MANPTTALLASRTVADVVSERPERLEILKSLGINHCCGAHLTLTEAAASAGIPLDRVLTALVEPGPLTLDVRGLEPPEPMVRILRRLDSLEADRELTVLHDRRPLFLYPQLDDRGYAHRTDEPEPGLVRIRIRRR